MFTSNGLMCLSGVTMCRMFLSAMKVSSASRFSNRRAGAGVDLRAAIEPCANTDVQTPCARMPARDRDKVIGSSPGFDKRKAGRAPGALADPERACTVEMMQDRRDVGTAEAP